MMKRRGFLQVLGAAIAAPLVPTPAPQLFPKDLCALEYVGVDLATQPGRTVIVTLAPIAPNAECVRRVADAMLREMQRVGMRQPFRANG